MSETAVKYDHSKRKLTTKHNIHIYYRTEITASGYENMREYYVSRFIGGPFLKFNLPNDFEDEKRVVAEHLGLKMRQINWRPHRGYSKS